MKIYRIETASGVGPFRWDFRGYEKFMEFVDLRIHPCPWDEFGRVEEGYIFGCKDMDQLDMWFCEEQREILARHGYGISVIWSDSYFVGETQVMFERGPLLSFEPLNQVFSELAAA